MTFKVRRPPRTSVTTIAMICIAAVVLPAAVADPMAFATEEQSASVNTTQRFGLAQEIAQFRSRIAMAQIALNLGQQDLSSQGMPSTSQPVGGTVGVNDSTGVEFNYAIGTRCDRRVVGDDHDSRTRASSTFEKYIGYLTGGF